MTNPLVVGSPFYNPKTGTVSANPASSASATAQSAATAGTQQTGFNAQNQPHALVYSAAINGINDALKPTLGDNAIQNAASEDNSSEATANRILAGSTGLLAAFKAQHPDETDDAAVTDFVSTIRGGFEKGFKEAAGILGALGALNGGVSDAINQTYKLVEKGYDDFEKANLSTPSDDDSDSTSGGTGTTTTTTSSSSGSATVTLQQT